MKIKSLITSLLLSCLTTNSFAEDRSDNNYDFNFSIDTNHQTSFTGADLSLSMIEAYRFVDDKIAPDGDSDLLNALMLIPRLMVTQYAVTFQHEVFGHGFRIREVGPGWKVTKYTFDLDGSGATHFKYNKNSHSQYMIGVTIAGMEATEVLSNQIKTRMLNLRTINPVYGAAYFNAAMDQIGYVYASDYKKESTGNDVQDYIKDMNTIYGSGYITSSKLKNRTALSLLDPFLYFSGYALVTGKDYEYPMIPIGDWGYLPALKAVFTPYGLESKLINHFKTPGTPFQLNFSQGKHKVGTSWSAELIIDKITEKGNVDIGCNIAIWKQPKLFYVDPLKAPNKIGHSVEVNLKINLDETKAIYTAIGYKTAGFRLGYPVRQAALLRTGLSFKL